MPMLQQDNDTNWQGQWARHPLGFVWKFGFRMSRENFGSSTVNNHCSAVRGFLIDRLSGTCGLVAMTSAQHAEGRQFDPGQVY